MFAIEQGGWLKTAEGCNEVRKKKLGIVGYGNIGAQLSVLASALGMHVYFYDVEPKLVHGNARPMDSLDALLAECDVVTLHVPSTPQTRNLMNATRIRSMKPGSILINQARGDLVDIDALAAALEDGHLAGAAVDVFPVEPSSKDERFTSPLQRQRNVILTPHIGGSTLEAQAAIGQDSAIKLAKYLYLGSTGHAVNFPQVEPGPIRPGCTRVAVPHKNAPGFLRRLNDAAERAGANVAAQFFCKPTRRSATRWPIWKASCPMTSWSASTRWTAPSAPGFCPPRQRARGDDRRAGQCRCDNPDCGL